MPPLLWNPYPFQPPYLTLRQAPAPLSLHVSFALTTTLVLVSDSVSMAKESPPRSWLSWVLPGFNTCLVLSRGLRLQLCLVFLAVHAES